MAGCSVVLCRASRVEERKCVIEMSGSGTNAAKLAQNGTHLEIFRPVISTLCLAEQYLLNEVLKMYLLLSQCLTMYQTNSS